LQALPKRRSEVPTFALESVAVLLDGECAMGIEGLDPVLHERVRLGILVLLVQAGELDFQTLKRALGVTDGNLAQHLRVLEEAGVIHARKGFQGRRPRTVYQLTESGRRRFEQYLEALRGLLGPLSGGQP